MTEYVTIADALFFHKHLIERYGGAPGLRDAGALESALHRPQTGYYDSIVHEAAALLESLIQNHPFADGNKRVAFAVVDVFLRINGGAITAESKSIYAYIIRLIEERAFDMEHLVFSSYCTNACARWAWVSMSPNRHGEGLPQVLGLQHQFEKSQTGWRDLPVRSRVGFLRTIDNLENGLAELSLLLMDDHRSMRHRVQNSKSLALNRSRNEQCQSQFRL